MNSVVGSGLPSPLAGLEECLSMENNMKQCFFLRHRELTKIS